MVRKKRVSNTSNIVKHNFIYNNFLIALKSIKEISKYIWFMAILFLVTFLVGFFYPIFFISEVTKIIKDLIEKTKGLNGINLIRFIMANNIQSAFSGILFGILFGIIPLGIVIVNGYVLGFVANKSAHAAGLFILWRLLPHGIFEIPAILISVGIGLKLGLFLFTYHGKNKGKEFLKWLIDAVRVFIFVVIPLLVIAGIIEGTLIWFMG